MYRYAQINANKTVIGISELSGEVIAENMILINDRPGVTFGWRFIDGEWLEPEPEPVIPVIPNASNDEVIQTIEDLKIDLIISGVIV